MKIELVEIKNYRRLEDVRIDFSTDTTLLVGPNNSGKSSAILAICGFLKAGSRFRLTDFTLNTLTEINQIGQDWTAELTPAQDQEQSRVVLEALSPVLPVLDIWISACENELGRVPTAVPLLEDYPGVFGVRLRLEPRDPQMFRQQYRSEFMDAEKQRGELEGVELRPADLVQFLELTLERDFEIRAYLLDSTARPKGMEFERLAAGTGSERLNSPENFDRSATPADRPEVNTQGSTEARIFPIPTRLIQGLIRVDLISATRGVSDADAEGTSGRLSGISGKFFTAHLQNTSGILSSDLEAIRAEQVAIRASNKVAQALFSETLDEIRGMGYPGGGDPGLIFESDVSFDIPTRQMFLRHQVGVGTVGARSLDESLSGLGYQSLIYMMFSLMGFRKSWLGSSGIPGDAEIPAGQLEEEVSGVAPIHLVLIEEPEAFLHAQVQQVFIKHALSVLRKGQDGAAHSGLHTQLVVSTHSSHIVQEVDFESIRYIRRETGRDAGAYPVSAVVNLVNLVQDASTTTRFVRRFIELTHCNMFFADALILVEGAAERILLPSMTKAFKSINAGYVEVIEIRGSHAHKIRNLVEVLGIPTLIVTDIDAMLLEEQEGETQAGDAKKPIPRKKQPSLEVGQVTGNVTLKTWLKRGEELDALAILLNDAKVVQAQSGGLIRFAFQMPLEDDGSVIPSTFEDAIALSNSALIAAMSGGPLMNKFARILGGASDTPAKAKQLFDALASADKAEFALDLLEGIPDQGELTIPQYIRDGLQWLDDVLSERGLITVVPEVLLPDDTRVSVGTPIGIPA